MVIFHGYVNVYQRVNAPIQSIIKFRSGYNPSMAGDIPQISYVVATCKPYINYIYINMYSPLNHKGYSMPSMPPRIAISRYFKGNMIIH